ncbi:DUF3224 domain-containing protein [Sphingomonas bacterium]|uniref:DUF3224 domain-containing protein n=1 Tax=Sphingomonas bacterium TaxID=1895847 RepID=UPI001C2DB1FF|nr:DUF3224 domain-containing protein [Sphingomonas bacterium]
MTIALAQTTPAIEPGKRAMSQHVATGTFDVSLTPVGTPDAAVGSMMIAKTFHGDLEGTSAGQMLAIRTPTSGSAGYVAMERVTGTIAGRRGSFALQHSGTMNRGAASLSVGVVPDSGTDGLLGISGTMEIEVSPGKHAYRFSYVLPTER